MLSKYLKCNQNARVSESVFAYVCQCARACRSFVLERERENDSERDREREQELENERDRQEGKKNGET